MGKGWTSDDPSPDAQKRIDELKEEIKGLSYALDTFRRFYADDTDTLCRLTVENMNLEDKVAELDGEVKYWKELARLSTSAHQNAVAMIVRTAGMTDEVIDIWYKRSMYAKNIIWGLIDWFKTDPGAEKLAVSGKLPKWVRKEMWSEPD
jgi:predicted nuclease with TOPRIM domain